MKRTEEQCRTLQDLKKKMRRVLLKERRNAHIQADKNTLLDMHVRIILDRFVEVHTIGFYWPLPDEFDARKVVLSWCTEFQERRSALPVIREQNAPLEFRVWNSSTPMQKGHHQITEPNSTEIVIPDLLLIPCIGFDLQNYRLGYGNGYYDRTLNMWRTELQPVTVGLAYESCKIDSLPVEAHDYRLDWIVTEVAIYDKT
ncbi:MAG: 5-formyltetrahydrofolate cyclo-ligase [Burkholderia sp.]|nr:5-formyltetrahydrofolate cyclo-ligase [Burkholderia sp.]